MTRDACGLALERVILTLESTYLTVKNKQVGGASANNLEPTLYRAKYSDP